MDETNNDYNTYDNLPKINGVILTGDISLSDLGIIREEMSSEELEEMWND